MEARDVNASEMQPHVVSCVLNAAAACPVFGRRTARAHYSQPPPQPAFKLPPRLLELAPLLPPVAHPCHALGVPQ
jgi:hypothetical protein